MLPIKHLSSRLIKSALALSITLTATAALAGYGHGTSKRDCSTPDVNEHVAVEDAVKYVTRRRLRYRDCQDAWQTYFDKFILEVALRSPSAENDELFRNYFRAVIDEKIATEHHVKLFYNSYFAYDLVALTYNEQFIPIAVHSVSAVCGSSNDPGRYNYFLGRIEDEVQSRKMRGFEAIDNIQDTREVMYQYGLAKRMLDQTCKAGY